MTLLHALVATALASPPATEPQPWAELLHPDVGEAAPSDGVFVVAQWDLDVAPVLRDPSGNEVDAAVHATIGADGALWKVLDPSAPLAAGEYVLFLGDTERTVTVSEGLAQPVEAPIPAVRTLVSPPSYARLSYRVCGDGAAFVVAVGDTEPAAPTFDALGGAWLAGEDVDLARVIELSAGWTGSVWFGSFDAAGRFSGWTGPDAVEMPAAGCSVGERMEGAEGDASGTPTSFSSCPVYGDWVVETALSCDSGDSGDEDVIVDSGGAATTDTGEASSGGCNTTATPSSLGLLPLLLLFGRRRA